MSAWSGLRPLVSPNHTANSTAKISRDHTILKSKTGLITITGGKWTTFRKMAADTINQVIKQLSSPNGFSGHSSELISVAGGENYDFDDLDQKLSATIEDEAIRHHLINYYGSRAIAIQAIIEEYGIEKLAPPISFYHRRGCLRLSL